MAKKKHRKKQNFKYGQTSAAVDRPLVTASNDTTSTAKGNQLSANLKKIGSEPRESVGFEHVKSDVVRVAALAAVFIGVELVLWFLFNHTGLGSATYKLIKL